MKVSYAIHEIGGAKGDREWGKDKLETATGKESSFVFFLRLNSTRNGRKYKFDQKRSKI